MFGKSSSTAGRSRQRRTQLLFESLEVRSLLAADLLADFAVNQPLPSQQYGTLSEPEFSATAVQAAEGESVAEGEDAPDLVAFAKALTASGAKFYGSAWCFFCTQQKELFQDGARFLPFVESSNPDRTLNAVGAANGIETFPTWIFDDGTRVTGAQTLQQLSELADVAIPTSSEPFIKPIEDTTLLIGAPLHVALDGYDPNGEGLTYTITSDNPLVTPTLLQGNRSMRINVESWGEMVFQLFEQRAERPAERVIELAQSDFYNGIIFHRVIENFVIQGGDPTGTGSGGSTLGDFDDQFHVDLQHVTKGTLSYAKSGDDTNDSQFFVTLDDTRHLDFNHSIFGQLVEGQSVLEAIGGTETSTGDKPTTDIKMESVEIFTDNENGMVMLKADPSAAGQQANITVTVSDGTGNTVQETFLVTVAADTSNGGPYLEDIPDVTTGIGTAVEIQLEAVDVEGDAVYYDANTTGSVQYTLDVDHDSGLVTVTPPPGYVGSFQVLVGVRAATTSNTTDTWDQQSITVTVAPSSPVVELLDASDSNVSGDNVTNLDSLTFRVSNVTNGATVKLMSGTTVVGQGTATGSTLDITTSNLAGLGDGVYTITAVQTLTGQSSENSDPISITLDREAPPAFTSTAPTSATNGTALVYDAANPEEGTDGFSYSLVGAPTGAAIDAATGVLTWTPTPSQGGARSFQIVATDLAGNTTSQSLNVDVTVVDQQALIELVITDDEENPLTEVSSGDDFYVWAYVQDVRSVPQGVYAAYIDLLYDSNIAVLQATTLQDVSFGNDYQNGKSGILTTPGLVDEIGAFGSGTTPLGGDKEVLFVLHFQADEAGTVTFTPEPSDVAGHELLVFGANNAIPWNAVTLTAASLTVDAGLEAVDDVFNVDEDSTSFPLPVLTNDTNQFGGTLTITQTGSTDQGGTVTIASDGQRLLYTPKANFFGEETFTYTINNGQVSSTAEVTVQVAPVNDAPTAVNDNLTANQGSSGNFLDVLANDTITPDVGETLRVTAVGQTSNGGTVTIGPNGTHLLYTPAAGFSGSETFTYTISDRASGVAGGLTSQATVTVQMGSEDRPTAGADTATVEEDSSANSIDVLANDTPSETGKALTISAVTQASKGGTVTIGSAATRVVYTPPANFFGTDTFTYTVKEADGGQTTQTVTVNVTAKNDPPTANDDSLNASKDGGAQTLDVLANDSILPDAGETLTITAVTQGSSGGTVAVSSDGKSVVFTPTAGFEGTKTFTYTISDGSGGTDTANVTVAVRPFVVRDIGGKVLFTSGSAGVGGLQLILKGTDDLNETINLTDLTAIDGSYSFEDLAPGTYTIERSSAVFLKQDGMTITVDSEDTDGDSTDNNFVKSYRDPAFVSIADFLARAPRQSSISATESMLVAAKPGGTQHWYSNLAGWTDFSDIEITLSADASQLTVTAVDSSGQAHVATIATTSSYVKLLGDASGSKLLRIDASPEQAGLKPASSVAPVVSVVAQTTNDTTPVITGSVSSGTLQVVVNNRTYTAGDGNLSVNGTKWTLQIPSAHALSAGTFNVAASATNSAGTGSDTTSSELIVDRTAPTVTVNSLTTDDTTPAITGTVSDGVLSVVVNNRTYTAGDGNLTVSGTNWSLQIPAAHALAAGTYNVAASASDAAGNVGSDATTNELVVSNAPIVTVTTQTTNDTTPIVTGTVSGGTLQVVLNNRTYTPGDGNLTVTGTNWSLQVPTAHVLTAGSYNVAASSTSSTGTGSDTTTNELVIDTTAPSVTVSALTTSDTTPTISGTVSDGTLKVVLNSKTYTAGDGNLSVSGTNWTLQVPTANALATGTYSVTASSTDAAGNVGTDATSNELVINNVPAVTVTTLTTNDATPVIAGTVSAGTLQVVVNSRTYTPGDGNLTVNGTNWTLQIPTAHVLPAGTYNVVASATSSSGTGSDTTTNELTIDTTAPVVTVSQLTTNDTTPVITGTVDSGTLKVVVNNRTYNAGDGNLTVSGTNWSLQVPSAHVLTTGTYSVTASSTDAAGNVGTDTTTSELVVTDLPVVIVNPLTTNDTTPAITGTVSAGTLQVVVNSQTYTAGDGNLSVSGTNWTLQIPAAAALTAGTYSVTASATGSTGTGTDSTSNELIIDTTAPVVTVNTLTTNDTTPAITGTVDSGTLNVVVNNRTYTVGDGNLSISGTNWTLQIPAAHTLTVGTYSVGASATDAAGNVGTDTTNSELVINNAPLVTVNALTTNDTTPALTGTVSAGTLQVVLNSRTYTPGDGNLSVTGTNWALQVPAAHQLAAGTYSVTASSTSSAGTGTDATSNELVIDTTAPAVTVNTLTSNDTTPSITGTVTDGTLTVALNNRTYTAGDGNLAVSGTNWTLQVPSAHVLTAGTYSVTAAATDAAGNVGTDPTSNELLISASSGEGEAVTDAIDAIWSDDDGLGDDPLSAWEAASAAEAYAAAVDSLLASGSV